MIISSILKDITVILPLYKTPCEKISLLKKIIASAARQPFFVAPNDKTSIPDFQVISAGVQFNAVKAFANRAPSICIFKLCLLAKLLTCSM